MKQIKVPKATHALLYMYAKDRRMTFGDAATRLIGIGLLHEYNLHDVLAQPESDRWKILHDAMTSRPKGSAAHCPTSIGPVWESPVGIVGTQRFDGAREDAPQFLSCECPSHAAETH